MKNSRRDVWVAMALAWAAFASYACFLSKAYVFEGLIRAMPIETGRWEHLLPGNYLLYGPLGLIFHTFLRVVGVVQPAVLSLQWMDALIGGVGIFIFYRLLRQMGGDPFAAIIWSSLLAFSLGYWLWSTDAEDYILSTCLLLINFYFLVKYSKGERVDPIVLGALHGLAILGHIVNVLFGAVIIWFFIQSGDRKWVRPVLRYAGAALVVAGGAYAMVLVLVRKPATVQEALNWFAGSAGTGGGGIQVGGAWSVSKLWVWLKMSLHILVSFHPPYSDPPAWAIAPMLLWAAVFFLAVFLLIFLKRFGEIYRQRPAVVGGCLVWIAAYAVVFTRWQPWTMVYRVSDLLPICTLLFLGFQSLPDNRSSRQLGRGAALAMVLCLSLGNLGAEVYPRSFASNNSHLERMAFLKAHTAEGDWITGDGGQDEIYIPYFAERRPIVIERFTGQPARLASFLDLLLRQGQNVFVTSRVEQSPEWTNFFKGYRLIPKATGPNGFVLYQIASYHEKDATRKASSAS